MSTGMGDEMPLNRDDDDVDSFKLGFTDVVDVPGDKPRVVVERNWDMLLLGVVSVSVALESMRLAPNVMILGDGGGRSTSTARARSGFAYGWEYSWTELPADGWDECPNTERLSPNASA